MELSSLKALYQLVVHCCELLSLWKLLCEYQLHLTAKELTNVRKKSRRKRKWRWVLALVSLSALQDQKTQLKTAHFRTMVVSGRQVCQCVYT